VHVVEAPAAHTPLWHVSFVSQALPSMQGVPSLTAGFEQTPVSGLHVPMAWHWSSAAHATVTPGVQAPETQVSFTSHALPSLQAVPSATVGFEHCPVDGLHVPAMWHWSEAVHVTGFDPAHIPLSHASVWVQAFPSLQVVPSATGGFEHCPVDGLQVPATWHWSDAVHMTGFDPVQVPLSHVSVCVQALSSLHDVPFARSEYWDVLTAGWHVSQAFVPLAAPLATHAPPMSQ
jgi:hypothetical protein